MSGRYLTDLDDVVRGAGLVCQLEPGWETRSRSSGGYASGRPTHVMVHHTASGPGSDGQADVNYCCYGSGDRPLANLYLARSGKVWVMAAGCTNTNGKGGPIDNVPADSMNTYAVGIEAANGGTGEPWPGAQTNAYVALVDALCAAYGIPNGHVRAHAEWAPGRKIDPAGPSPWATGGATWNMPAFRSSCASSAGPGPAPGPEPGPDLEQIGDDMIVFQISDAKNTNPYYVSNGVNYRAITDQAGVDALRAMLTGAGQPWKVNRCTKAQMSWAGVYAGVAGQPSTNAVNPYL